MRCDSRKTKQNKTLTLRAYDIDKPTVEELTVFPASTTNSAAKNTIKLPRNSSLTDSHLQ